MTITHTSHARYDLWYHFAWCTKYRRKVFTNKETRQEVKELLRKIATEYDMKISEIEVSEEHVYLSLSAPPRIAPAKAVQILKSVSTNILFKQYSWLRSMYWGGEIWVQGYFVRSVGPNLTKEQIDKYIKEQSEEI